MNPAYTPSPAENVADAWKFNGDYHDLAQIIPFIDAYWSVYEQLRAENQYPYNAAFEGSIPALACAQPKEETPIYLLQGLRGLVEGHETLAEYLRAGYEPVIELAERERYDRIVVFNRYWQRQEYEGARLVPDEAGQVCALLPKGNRTRGRRLEVLDHVYVLNS
jgi:hypothetical protein